MISLTLHRVEDFHDGVGGQGITSGFSTADELHDFCPGFRFVEKHAPHGTGCHRRVLLHHTTAAHAPVVCFQNNGGSKWLKMVLQIIGNGFRDALLILQTSGVQINKACKFADAHNSIHGDVGHVSVPRKGLKVVLTSAVELNVAEQNLSLIHI